MDEGIEGESDTYFVLVFIVSVNSLTYTTIVYNQFNNFCNYIVCSVVACCGLLSLLSCVCVIFRRHIPRHSCCLEFQTTDGRLCKFRGWSCP